MEKEELKKYKETVNKIKEIMKYEMDLRRVFGDRLPVIKKALEIMECQMDDLAQDKKIEASDKDKSTVKEALNLFLSIAVSQPITLIFRDLSKTYLLLAFNWNRELGKRQDMESAIRAVQGIVEGQLTMFDTINLLKTLSQRGREMLDYRPPAFELSRHYLESLREEKREKKRGKEEKGKRDSSIQGSRRQKPEI